MHNCKWKKIFSIILVCGVMYGQGSENLRDTSFTVYSAYKKVVKKFPSARIVAPSPKPGVIEYANVVYRKIGDRFLHIDIFRNEKIKVLNPCVILVHGGGWHSGNKSHMQPLALDLASEGYVTAAVEYRLSQEALFPAAVLDLKSAVKFLKENTIAYGIDTSRIAILGCSAGGQLASLVGYINGNKKFEPEDFLSQHSSNVQAVLNIDGLLDFTSSESKEFDIEPAKPKSAHKWFGYSYKENPELWNEGSAISYVDKNDVPILFVNSAIPHYHAGRDAMIKKLKEYEIYFEVHKIKNSPHPFWLFHPWYKETLEIAEGFLKRIFSN